MGLFAFRRLREKEAKKAVESKLVEQDQPTASPAAKRRYTKRKQASKNNSD